MRRCRWLVCMCLLVISFLLSACKKTPDDLKPEVKEKNTEYSENILLSINQGAPGYGTEIDCIDAEVFIYTDGSVKAMVYYPEETELMSFKLTEEENEKVMQIGEPSKVAKLKVRNDNDVCDGSSYHIALYDRNDERVVYKGGYMPVGKKFWETYDGLQEILEPYKIYEKLEEYRSMLQELEDNPEVAPNPEDEEEEEIFKLLQGEWLCESGSAYLRFYEENHNYYMDCYGDWQIHESVEYFNGAPLYELYYGYFDRWKEEEDTLPENEIRVAYTTQKGEFDYGGEFVVDKSSGYLISELMQEDKAYYFYPYEEEMPIGNYVHIAPMAKRIGELVGNEQLQYESLWQVAEKLVSSNMIYFYPGHGEVTVLEDGTYLIETIASGYEEIDGTAKAVDYDLRFFIDGEGNPIKENEWEIKKN